MFVYFKKLAIFKRIEKQNILRFGEGRNVDFFFFSMILWKEMRDNKQEKCWVPFTSVLFKIECYRLISRI